MPSEKKNLRKNLPQLAEVQKSQNRRCKLQSNKKFMITSPISSSRVPLEPQENVLSHHTVKTRRTLKPRQLWGKMCENREKREISFSPEMITKCLQNPLLRV